MLLLIQTPSLIDDAYLQRTPHERLPHATDSSQAFNGTLFTKSASGCKVRNPSEMHVLNPSTFFKISRDITDS